MSDIMSFIELLNRINDTNILDAFINQPVVKNHVQLVLLIN